MESNENKRYTLWDIVTYAEEEEFQQVLEEIAVRYAYIKHDKDVTEEGELKVAHTHILLTSKSAMSFTAILGYFQRASKQNTRVLGITANYVGNRYEYLTHKNEEGKYKYNKEDIVTNDREYYEKYTGWRATTEKEQDEEERNANFMADLLGDTISIREMGIKYGRDFIKNVDKYMRFRRMAFEEFKELTSDEDLT